MNKSIFRDKIRKQIITNISVDNELITINNINREFMMEINDY